MATPCVLMRPGSQAVSGAVVRRFRQKERGGQSAEFTFDNAVEPTFPFRLPSEAHNRIAGDVTVSEE